MVEDDPSIAGLVALYLRHDGHEVDLVANGADALRWFQADPVRWDLLVVDLMLPGLDGRGLARRVRTESGVPIIMLTALDGPTDRLEGFALGADDYVAKPFVPAELVARVRAVLRRSTPVAAPIAGVEGVVVGNLTVSTLSRSAEVEGTTIDLRPRELALLIALAEHPGAALSRGQLLELVWRDEVDGDTRTVDMHVSRLRERLRAAGATVAIETVRSFGYRLRERR